MQCKSTPFFFSIFIFLYRGCVVLRAAAERKRPTAWLKPGFPQNPFPRHLVWNLIYIVDQGFSMAFHSFGGLCEDLRVSGLALGGQWVGLRGIPEKVKNQRRVVVGHVFSKALTDTGVVASTSTGWGKVRSKKVHLKDRVTWTETTGKSQNLGRKTEAQRFKQKPFYIRFLGNAHIVSMSKDLSC